MAKSDKWCCKNPGCKMLNIVEPAQIEDLQKEVGRQYSFVIIADFARWTRSIARIIYATLH